MQNRLWQLRELNFRPDELLHSETLFTIGNGYLSTRGAFEEGYPGDTPTTMVHGIYDHAPGALVPELVNAPNWLPIRVTIDGTPLQLATMNTGLMDAPEGFALGYERTLDLHRAVLTREVLFRAGSGAIVRVVFERFASLHDPHVMVQRVQIVGVEGTPTLRVESAIDGGVTNAGARHWLPDRITHADSNQIGLQVTTQQSGYVLGMASQLITPLKVDSRVEAAQLITATQEFTLQPEQTASFDKFTAVYTSRDDDAPLELGAAQGERGGALRL